MKIVLKVLLRSLAVIGVTLALVLILLVGACFLAMHGPSPAFRSQFAMFAYETSALKWLPRLFLGNDEFEKIIAENTMPEAAEGTASNTELIVIPDETVVEITPVPTDGARTIRLRPATLVRKSIASLNSVRVETMVGLATISALGIPAAERIKSSSSSTIKAGSPPVQYQITSIFPSLAFKRERELSSASTRFL